MTSRQLVIRHLAIALATTALVLAHGARAAEQRGAMQGVVKDNGGNAVTGAFVRLRNEAQRLTFLVVSRNEGRFEANGLPPGQYTVQGIGGTFQSAVTAPVTVAAGQNA